MSSKHPTSPEADALSPEMLKVALELWSQTKDAQYLPVKGGSMLPLLREGDLVLVTPSREPKVGDIVVVQILDELVTHRVLWIRTTASGERNLLIKGDHVLSMDPPIPDAQLLGRVVAIRRGTSRMNLDTPFQSSIGKEIAELMRLQAELYRRASRAKAGAFSYAAVFAEKSLSRILLRVGNVTIWVTQFMFGRWTR